MHFKYDDLEGTCIPASQHPPAFRAVNTRSTLPIRVILDLTTPLETITGSIALIMFGGTVFYTILAISESGADAEKTWPIAIVCWILLIAFALAWWSSDCYYVIDGKQKKFLYHFSILGITRETMIATFDQIRAIAIDAWESYKLKKKKYDKYTVVYEGREYSWEYAIVVVLHNCDRIRVSDYFFESEQISHCAEKAARVVGCEFQPQGHIWRY